MNSIEEDSGIEMSDLHNNTDHNHNDESEK